jgi:hypothetical protein
MVPSYMQHFYKNIMRLLNLFKNYIGHYMFRPSYGHHQVLQNCSKETAVLAFFL